VWPRDSSSSKTPLVTHTPTYQITYELCVLMHQVHMSNICPTCRLQQSTGCQLSRQDYSQDQQAGNVANLVIAYTNRSKNYKLAYNKIRWRLPIPYHTMCCFLALQMILMWAMRNLQAAIIKLDSMFICIYNCVHIYVSCAFKGT